MIVANSGVDLIDVFPKRTASIQFSSRKTGSYHRIVQPVSLFTMVSTSRNHNNQKTANSGFFHQTAFQNSGSYLGTPKIPIDTHANPLPYPICLQYNILLNNIPRSTHIATQSINQTQIMRRLK